MNKPKPYRKIDAYGNIITESFEAVPANAMFEQETEEEVEGPQLLKDEEEDIDIESEGSSLYDTLNGLPAEEEEEEPAEEVQTTNEPTTNSPMQVVSLEDVLALLKQVQGETATPVAAAQVTVTSDATPSSKGLVGGEEALKKVYFQGEGHETLDSEFDFSNQSAHALEAKFQDQEKYIDSIDGMPKDYSDYDDLDKNGTARPQISHIGLQGGTTIYDDMDGGDEANPDLARLGGEVEDETIGAMSVSCEGDDELLLDGNGEPEPKEIDEEEEPEAAQSQNSASKSLSEFNEPTNINSFEEVPSWIKDFLASQGVDPKAAWEQFGKEANSELHEIDDVEEENVVDYGDDANPDLIRFAGPVAQAEEDEEFEEIDPSEYEEPAVEEPETVTTNSTVNIGGTPIKIILTGVVISEGEIKYISESVKHAGNKLKAIQGEGNNLQIVVEANDKQYTINYVDAPKVKEPTPFSIRNLRFGTLEEALGRINHNNVPKTQEVFKSLMTEAISTRGFSNAQDADIFEGIMESKANQVATWTVRAAGTVNLKNGLNETFSNIMQHGTEPNTLVKTEEGEYFILKGNLRERSDLGTVRELVDIVGKKSYGVAKVVGIFENNSKGLGKVMEKLKRTSLPLLVWK